MYYRDIESNTQDKRNHDLDLKEAAKARLTKNRNNKMMKSHARKAKNV